MNPQLDLFQITKGFEPKNSYEKIRGLQYIRDFITHDEEQILLKTIDNQIWINDLRRRGTTLWI